MYKSPLHKMVCTTPTEFWNDSCDVEELEYAIEHGAVGATTNPPIVHGVYKKAPQFWSKVVREIIETNPTASEHEVTWELISRLAVTGAKILEPIFVEHKGKKGRLSVQVDPTRYRDKKAMLEHAIRLASLAPNMQVKMPATSAGIEAIEEATARGVNVNVTVCFSVSQAVAGAEAIERGLKKAEESKIDVSRMSPVCTIMVGRIEDWLYVLLNRHGVIANPVCVPWCGIAIFKKAYQIFKARNYRARLLAAAYRHHLHWTEFVGGEVTLTMPSEWQKRFNASGIDPVPRIHIPVENWIIEELRKRFPDFVRAYEEGGLDIKDFDTFPPTIRTLRQFIGAYRDLMATVRDVMLEDPDIVRSKA